MNQQLVHFQVDRPVATEGLAEIPAEIAPQLASERPLLVTASLRSAINQVEPLLRSMLELRARAGAETLVIACENSPDPIYQELSASFKGVSGLQFVPAVVNRVCPKFIEKDDSHGRRTVLAHPIGEWAIERPEGASEIVAHLERQEEVEFVDDITPLKARKLWSVNGGHLALALLAARSVAPASADESFADVRLDHLALDRKMATLVAFFHAGLEPVLKAKFPDFEHELDYYDRHFTAFCETPDEMGRVLKLHEGPLQEVFSAFDQRISAPAREYQGGGLGPRPDIFLKILDALEDLLDRVGSLRGHLAVDVCAPERLDAGALEAYDELMRGWVDQGSRGSRLRRLDDSLKSARRRQRLRARG